MATAAERLALGFNRPGTAVIPRPYQPNWTIPDPKIEAKYAAASAEAAHGERVNPTPKHAPTFSPNDPRAYGDGRFGAPANNATPAASQMAQPAPKPAMPAAAAKAGGPFYSRPLSQMAGGAANKAGGLAKGAARFMSAPVAVGAAGIAGAAQGMGTDTEQYAKRFGMENTEPGLLRDLGLRGLGVASDVGNALTLGLAGNFYRDKQEPAPQQSRPTITPDSTATPLAQMDPTSVARKDPANPLKDQAMPSAQSALTQIAPGVYKHGRGQYSDDASGMGMGEFTGRPNAQNMAAADALANRYRSNPLAAQATPQGSMTVGEGGGVGLLDNNARSLRNAMVDAQQMKPGSRTALAALLRQQGDQPNQQIARDRLAQEGRESEQSMGLKTRELDQRASEVAQNVGLKREELADSSLTNALKREAAGTELKAAQRLQQLQNDYLNAETEQDRAKAMQRLSALSGKSAQDEYIAVGAGETIVDEMGNKVKNPDILVNKRTGQPVGGQKAQPALPPGMSRQVGTSGGKPVYEDANGNRFVVG